MLTACRRQCALVISSKQIGSQVPAHKKSLTKANSMAEPNPIAVPASSPSDDQNKPDMTIINNHTAGETLEVLRREFGKIGEGNFDLFKDEQSGIAVLTIDQPVRKNSFSGRMMAQLGDKLTELENWEQGKALIIQGRNGFFCSGGDLTTVKHIATHEGARQMAIIMQDNLNRLQSLPLLTVALIEGKAIGGGAEFSTACDFRLMTPSAKIGFVHVRIAISAGWGGGSRLVQLVGPTRALEMMASGEQLSAKQALDYGLISTILDQAIEKDPDDVMAKARDWLGPYIAGPKVTLRAIKGIVNGAKRLPLPEALDNELKHFTTTWGSADHLLALSKNVKHK